MQHIDIKNNSFEKKNKIKFQKLEISLKKNFKNKFQKVRNFTIILKKIIKKFQKIETLYIKKIFK
jgi:hypothetical protein